MNSELYVMNSDRSRPLKFPFTSKSTINSFKSRVFFTFVHQNPIRSSHYPVRYRARLYAQAQNNIRKHHFQIYFKQVCSCVDKNTDLNYLYVQFHVYILIYIRTVKVTKSVMESWYAMAVPHSGLKSEYQFYITKIHFNCYT